MKMSSARAVEPNRESVLIPCGSRRRGRALASRLLVIGAVCTFLCACGGGGGGGASDTHVATPPPQKTELAWDSGNWDQQEWQ